MPLPLELGALQDPYVRRGFEEVSRRFPLGPTDLLGAAPTTAATFPSNAAEGQDFYYRLSTGGVWHFKYSTSAAKWDFAGGPPLFSEVTTSTTRAVNAYGDPVSGSGPSVTVPFAGDYEVWIGAGMFQTTGGAGYMSYDIGGTGAVDADSISQSSLATGIYQSRPRVKTGVAANTLLAAKYKSTANTLNIFDRWMRVLPVRVG